MDIKIESIKEKTLIGISLYMSYTNNKTYELWSRFSPIINEVKNKIDTNRYSLQIYDSEYFKNFNPNSEFEKWATVEVSSIDDIPKEMKIFILQGGLYARFFYKGSSENGQEVFKYIFQEWIPNSKYILDNRPHFEILGDKYKNKDIESEEYIYIPIKEKK